MDAQTFQIACPAGAGCGSYAPAEGGAGQAGAGLDIDPSRVLTLYSRAWCSLCDKMIDDLEPLALEFGLTVYLVDIDESPVFEDRYGMLIPILVPGSVGAEAEPLCQTILDPAAVRAWAEIK
ncbi:MAG: glutaredoxin family protein [Candidatus Protistobacter heckmanni]|nr:glutaredoxin family protein [Candidatus Protistobacter heckmanni]